MSKEKLSHRVVYCSSEDSGHLAHELSFSSSSDNNNNNKGWISSKQSNYPQELGFELLSRSNDCILTQIQLLSHQSKISTKIEVYAGLGSSYETALFKRLGFLTLDSNERSAFQARELKTVFVDQIPSNYVKFKLHKNHINDHNLYNQVGIMLVNFCGYESTNHNQKPALPYAHANSSSSSIDNDGTEVYSYNQYSSPRGNEVKPFGIEVKLDPPILARLTLLADAKKRAIDEEDYITAKAIKQVESDLKELTTALASLDLSKKEAVAAEDFDRAKELKEQGDEIRMQLNQKVYKNLIYYTY